LCLLLWQNEEKQQQNDTVEQRVCELETHYAEATTLLHLQGTLILDLQVAPPFYPLLGHFTFFHVRFVSTNHVAGGGDCLPIVGIAPWPNSKHKHGQQT